MVLVVVMLVVTFGWRLKWWMFIDIFFMFMSAFCYLLSLYFGRISVVAARKLNTIAMICGVLWIVALAVEYFLM